ncbi:MAG: LssY C-terminal domain-containing protein [Luminiphilus sp.]|jgi:hypothetical protein
MKRLFASGIGSVMILRSIAVWALPLLIACTPAWQKPMSADAVDILSDSKTVTRNGVTVTVAVPSAEQTLQLFGTDLYKSRVQPVWVRVENTTAQDLTLIRNAIDDAYVSPAEAAYLRHAGSAETKRAMDIFFQESEFKNPIKSDTTVAGYVFTNLEEGFKNVNVDLLGDDLLINVALAVKIPGLNTDVEYVDLDGLYSSIENIEDVADFQSRLRNEPCCTTNKQNTDEGDPLNVVLVGSRDAIFTALIRRGWHSTEVNHMKSAIKTTRSFLFGSQYLYSPISPLYLYGRSQDIGLQKARQSIRRRNHMRLWRAPYDFQGNEVYVGQISRDIGVKLNKRTLTTHAIDPYVDHTRDSLAGDLAYSQSLSGVAYVSGSQRSTQEQPFYNLTPDPYFSDGYRAVFFFTETPVSLTEIDQLKWLPQWHPSLQPDTSGQD